MIGKLKGIIEHISDDHLILDVNGVGYLVFCAQKTLGNLPTGGFIEIFIETHVREDHIKLYGFKTTEEKSTFNILQSVKGVGARMALAILSTLSPHQIQTALIKQNKGLFRQVTGVGGRIAERIIIELKDKVISHNLPDVSAHDAVNAQVSSSNKNLYDDAVSALISLGINKSDAHSRVSNILALHDDLAINDLIRIALKN